MDDSQGQAPSPQGPTPPLQGAMPSSQGATPPPQGGALPPLQGSASGSDKPRVRVDEKGNPVIPPSPAPQQSGAAGDGRLQPPQKEHTSGELKSARDRRYMRWAAFVIYGVTSLAFFGFLLVVLCRVLTDVKLVYLYSKSTHPPLVFAGVVVVVLATVPLSIAHALMHMGSEPSLKKAKKQAKTEQLAITTPSLEAARTIAEFFKKLMGDGEGKA